VVVLQGLIFVLGAALIVGTFLSAIRTFVVPRGVSDRLTGVVFVVMRGIFDLALSPMRSDAQRERAMAFYAPLSLLALPVVWLAALLIGYTALFWAMGDSAWSVAFTDSRSSLLTLGFTAPDAPAALASFLEIVSFSETVLSLILAALLVAYLPTMYAAFSQREVAVTGLETLAGSPPSPFRMLKRYHRIGGLDDIDEVWATWLDWFNVVQESHTSLQPLVFYRSPRPDRSWVTAAGAVLDTAALTASTLDRPRDPQAELCIRAGYLCLQRIADTFRIPYDPNPRPDAPISVARTEFDALYDALATEGVPLKPDRDQAWRDFAGWRVNYDAALIALAVLTMAPDAQWSSDRAPRRAPAFTRPDKRARAVAADITAGVIAGR